MGSESIGLALLQEGQLLALERAHVLLDRLEVLGLPPVEIDGHVLLQLLELDVEGGGREMARDIGEILELVRERRLGDDGLEILQAVDDFPEAVRRTRVAREGEAGFLVLDDEAGGRHDVRYEDGTDGQAVDENGLFGAYLDELENGGEVVGKAGEVRPGDLVEEG